jgi:hypothetical protein
MGRVKCIQFHVAAFRNYASDTAWLLQHGLELEGFTPFGRRFPGEQDCTDMRAVCQRERPDVVFSEAWNTWNPEMPQPASKDIGFDNYDWLGSQPGIFRVTNHDDPWGHPEKHAEWHRRFRPDVILVRYEIARVLQIAPYVERSKLMRIHHSVTREYCRPVTAEGRDRVCLLSGASSERIYPMRARLWREVQQLPDWERTFTIRPHHHWSRTGGSAVPDYMRALAGFRVMFVGTSVFKVAFKKLYEGTAAGCIVVTNLPETDRVPVVEENLVRVSDDIGAADLRDLCEGLAARWDLDRQRDLARRVIDRYDYQSEAARIRRGVLARAGIPEGGVF